MAEDDAGADDGGEDDDDPLIAEIRAIRRRISEQFGNDPVRLFDHIVEYQQRFKDRLVSRNDLLREEDGESPA